MPPCYAWRRANLAELNRRGREAWEALGRLSGPELIVGTSGYRAADRIVTLAPGAGGEIVTSERGTVAGVDINRRELGATMDDGRFQRFAGDDLDGDHLAHGYAVTVHRFQGSTVARAHALEDGGGRELAYVKISRAKQRSTVYVVADSMAQAVEDLERSWSQSRRIGWAIDRGIPAPGAEVAEPTHRPVRDIDAGVRRARLGSEREAVAAVVPTDPGPAYPRLRNRVQRLEREQEGIDRGDGWGAWRHTPVGDAAIAWQKALGEWSWCSAQARQVGWRHRYSLLRRADLAAEREGPLRDAFGRPSGASRI